MAKIFVLVGTSQYYEDCDTWVAGAFSSVEAAEARKKAAEARIAEIHQEAYRRDRLPPRSAVILPQQELHVRTRKTSMEAKKRRSSPPRQTISRPLSDLLSAILAQKEGPVIEGRVKVISENRFRTSLDTLLATWVELGGAYDSLEREIRRGEIEIVEARPGFGKRGLYGDKDMKTLEFVVHNDVRL
jgi:hypothetical protein